ncbi:MAG TPA: post-COAP-1 domain-containing protein, partial [Candidatus Limnocylindria bacterium]
SKDGRTVTGNLEYKSATTAFKATSFLGLGISADSRIAIFAGTGTTGGKSPTTVRFLVKATDNGEPGTNDTFVISFDGGTTFLPAGADGGKLVGGNIQIHLGR